MAKKPKILITNDDGISAPGLFALKRAVSGLGKITIVAPDRQQSAVGHSLTISKPLRILKHYSNGKFFGYTVNGTPTDCVKIAISELFDKKPDMVISGINHGNNTSINIIYSGTVSAAIEGMLLDIPSIAFSLSSFSLSADFTAGEYFAKIIVKKVLEIEIPKGTFLNVNIPALPLKDIKGIKITHLSNSVWQDKYEKRVDPFGREYYWFSGNYTILDKDENADDIAIKNGFVSITPIKFDLLNQDFLIKLRNIKFL